MAGKKAVKKAEAVEAEVVVEERQTMPQTTSQAGATLNPMMLIERALQGDSNASLEQLERLYDLQLKYEANEARKAYHVAVAEFKKNNIRIIKKSNVHFTSSKGTTDYMHASLGDVIDQIIEALSKVGLSHSWSPHQDGNSIGITCTLTHVLGHSESVTMWADRDDSGGKNKIQAVASSSTYLSRYTTLLILGLATHDDDGRGGGADDAVELVSEHQVAELEAVVLDVQADTAKLCTFLSKHLKYEINSLEDIHAEHYNFVCKTVEAKRGN